MPSISLVKCVITISIWRCISARSARTYVVIHSLRWEGRGGLAVNTYSGLSLSLCAGDNDAVTMHLCVKRRTVAILSTGWGVTIFPPMKLFFNTHTMDALWPLNENCSFQCAFHQGQWMTNQHLYKMLLLPLLPPFPFGSILPGLPSPFTTILWS